MHIDNPFAVLAATLLSASPAAAHVTLQDPVAKAGSYYAGFFQVSHGCAQSPTIAVRIEIPGGVSVARPQPKPGWVLSKDQTQPSSPAGGAAEKRITAVTWSGGRLAADEFDQFAIMLKLPPALGTLAFAVTQTCESGEERWTEVRGPGHHQHGLKHPAPVLTIQPAEAATGPGMIMPDGSRM